MTKSFPLLCLGFLLLVAQCVRAADAPPSIFSHDNLVAWCIVPFDAKERTPEQRADMLERLGFKHYCYDWRAKQLPTFEAELDALKKHNIELTGVWFPDSLNPDARFILDALKMHAVKTQLWINSEVTTVDAAEKALRPIAEEAAKMGCTVTLYNHGHWFGEPENQLAIIQRLNLPNVNMVYNLHHGQAHLDRFPQILHDTLPHLTCVTLNGMTKGGEMILPIGKGQEDLKILHAIVASGYKGRLAILNHTDLDAEVRLRENLAGLDSLVTQLSAAPPDHWGVEDADARERLPLYQTIPAATPSELTPANSWPESSATWPRSHGNDANTRFSPLDQINRTNVQSLQVAWTYHSHDGTGNIQCNPIIVDGVMYAPTPGGHIVAIYAATGAELWRFAAGKNPAARGLTFHPGIARSPPRLLFAAGKSLWALNPKDGAPITTFGDSGKIPITDCAVAPAVFQNTLIYPGWNGDLFGVDLISGKPLWTFHTIPRGVEPFAQTWDQPEAGANCWGGMAIDSSRGIVYVTTGSPKPNFIGVNHLGDNLFGNCVLAIDAVTGKYLWHFQTIRHDIWDLDIAAPPVLVTVTHDGKKIDAVAAISKPGDTLLLDRVTGKPLFPVRLRRAPASALPGEQTAAYQPDIELPEPVERMEFTPNDITDISPTAHQYVADLLQRSGATFGQYRPFTEGKPLAYFGLHGGAEWTGATFDPTTATLYVSVNHVAWLPSVHRFQRSLVDETTLPLTPGRAIYARTCMTCHGPNREGQKMFPSLLGLSQRRTESEVIAMWTNGRGQMPALAIPDHDAKLLLDYLFDRDRTYPASTTRPERPTYRDNGYPKLLDEENYPGNKPPWGTLVAINLNTGKINWRVPLGEHPELTHRGIPKTGTENFGGPSATAGGLIFCAGTRDLKLRAFNSTTGQELWSHTLPFGAFAPPSIYEVNGKQFIVLPSTGGGKLSVPPFPGPAQPQGDAYIAFSLP